MIGDIFYITNLSPFVVFELIQTQETVDGMNSTYYRHVYAPTGRVIHPLTSMLPVPNENFTAIDYPDSDVFDTPSASMVNSLKKLPHLTTTLQKLYPEHFI
jgi:hypothetical protein